MSVSTLGEFIDKPVYVYIIGWDMWCLNMCRRKLDTYSHLLCPVWWLLDTGSSWNITCDVATVAAAEQKARGDGSASGDNWHLLLLPPQSPRRFVWKPVLQLSGTFTQILSRPGSVMSSKYYNQMQQVLHLPWPLAPSALVRWVHGEKVCQSSPL